MKVMIAAAGTGGHVFPGLAVADTLLQQQHKVVWLATDQGKELQWINQAGVSLTCLQMSGVRGKGWKGWFKAPFQLFSAWRQAIQILRQQDPDVLLVMGGYVSVPAGLAASWLGIPFCVHEQNSVAGLSNQLLAPLSQSILLGLPLHKTPIGWSQAQLVGNPLRAMLVRQPKKSAHRPLRLLMIGGSQGAQFINETMPEVMQDWTFRHEFSVWHQTGRAMKEQVENAYQQAGMDARVCDFIHDMGEAYAWADLVIARSGALTVTELMQVARPALFIPFPYAVDDHQFTNCLSLVKAELAEVVRQDQASIDYFRERLFDYLTNPQTLILRYQRLNAQVQNTAASQVATRVIALAAHQPLQEQ